MKRAPSFSSRSSLAHLAIFVIAVAGCATGAGGAGDSTVDPAAGGGGTGGDTDAGAGAFANGSNPYESGDDAGSSTPSTPSKPGKGDGGTTPSNPSGTDSGSQPPPNNPPPNNPPPTSAPQAGPGDIVVSEVMYNPSGAEPDTEWFEIKSTASGPVALDGLTLVDGSSNTHTISGGASPIVVNPGDYVVLARNKSAASTAGVPSSAIVYQYAAISLANGTTGHLTIKQGSTTVADVPFGSWTAASNGESIELKTGMPPSTAGNWCFAGASWSTGSDLGTPGAASDCP